MKIAVKKLREGAALPTRWSASAAGYDLRACIEESVIIAPGATAMVGTGLSIAVPEGYFGAVFARSGLAAKQGVRPANCVGVCDSDYRGEIRVSLINRGREDFTVHPGDRIAQLMFAPVLHAVFEEAETLDETARGEGGFGSTGISAAKP